MSDKIVWTNEKRKLSDLIPWPRNPRKIDERGAERLVESYRTFNQVETIAIGPGNEIYNGHQRLREWANEFGDIEVDVRVSSRPLTEKEREQLTVFLHRGATGEWDFDKFDGWDVGDLVDWGFEAWEVTDNPPNDIDELWKDMPEFEQDDIEPHHSIKVHFASKGDVDAFSLLIGQTVTDKTTFIWYPKQEKMNLMKMACIDES